MKKILLLVGLLILGCSPSFATLCTGIVPYATTGQVTSVNLNNNLTACQGTINGLLDNTNANVAAGYRFYQTVSSLPVAGNQGATYFLTSDNSLNLDNGSSFNKLLSPSGSAAQGEVVFYGASGLTYTGVGTSGQPLISGGAAANATFGNISASGSVSGAALTSLSSTPSGAGLLPAANVGGMFGTWTTPSCTSSGTAHQAATDGIFITNITTINNQLFCYTDSNSTPSTLRSQATAVNISSQFTTCETPVRKNDYYMAITVNGGTCSSFFLPMGS